MKPNCFVHLCSGLVLTLTLSCQKSQATLSSVEALASESRPTQAHQVPQNPYLADSPWPMSHQNPYQQGSSPFNGPTSTMDLATNHHLKAGYVNITQAISSPYPTGERVAWGSNVSHVYKTIFGTTPEVVAKVRKEGTGHISGAYTLVDAEGQFFVPTKKSIYKYTDEDQNDPRSGIKLTGSFDLPAGDFGDIVGINLTYDGFIIYATSKGLVGAVSRDFRQSSSLSLAWDGGEISNSIAVDEDGGIYVVTSEQMHRVQWNGQKLSVLWSSPYETGGDILVPGRLGKGSGSTPSLMGVGEEDQFVVITDGQELAHLVLFWRHDIPEDFEPIAPGKSRRIAAEVPIKFGDQQATSSMSEQSVLVHGHKAVVVNNDYNTPIAPKLDLLARIWSFLTVLQSNNPRIAPYGVEQFQWDPNTRTLQSSWVNEAISCPNAIPTMSAQNGLMYCVGQRQGIWNIEAIDWQTGDSAFHIPLKRHTSYNSFYAATQIGVDGQIVYGTLDGLITLQ